MIHLGLTGYPLAHSLSPVLHSAALRHCGLAGDYSLFPVAPGDLQNLERVLACLRSGSIAGLNVTIPHKQAVIPLLDELTPRARVIGAVNTVLVRAGRLVGDNTDAPGFLADLKHTVRTLPAGSDPSALVLGAGGAACAVVYALLSDGWQITVAARRADQVRELLCRFPAARTAQAGLQAQSLEPILTTCSLIVNATPVGMAPAVHSSPWPAGLVYPQAAAVYDLVYNPRETLFVRRGRQAGLQAVTGLGMLVEQAALAFELWTGHSIPRSILFEALN